MWTALWIVILIVVGTIVATALCGGGREPDDDGDGRTKGER